MTDRIFDANAVFETYRNAMAPVLGAQQEALKAFERVARYQYAVAGDCLEWTLNQAQAFAAARTPSELVAKQAELGTRIGEQLRGRVQEFSTIASESQQVLNTIVNEATAKVTEFARKAA
jgi:phasin family protein